MRNAVGVSMDNDLRDELTRVAAEYSMSRSRLIERLCIHHLKKMKGWESVSPLKKKEWLQPDPLIESMLSQD